MDTTSGHVDRQSGNNEFRKELACFMPCGRKEYLSEMSQFKCKLVELVN